MNENVSGNLRDNIQENIHENLQEFAERKTSFQNARVMAGGMVTLLATIIAIYIGGWLMLLVPLKQTLEAFFAGMLTRQMLFATALKCAFSLTTGGAVWCAGYIISRKIIGYEDY